MGEAVVFWASIRRKEGLMREAMVPWTLETGTQERETKL